MSYSASRRWRTASRPDVDGCGGPSSEHPFLLDAFEHTGEDNKHHVSGWCSQDGTRPTAAPESIQTPHQSFCWVMLVQKPPVWLVAGIESTLPYSVSSPVTCFSTLPLTEATWWTGLKNILPHSSSELDSLGSTVIFTDGESVLPLWLLCSSFLISFFWFFMFQMKTSKQTSKTKFIKFSKVVYEKDVQPLTVSGLQFGS